MDQHLVHVMMNHPLKVIIAHQVKLIVNLIEDHLVKLIMLNLSQEKVMENHPVNLIMVILDHLVQVNPLGLIV